MTPEEVDEFRDALGAQSNAELEAYFEKKLPQITSAIKQAVAAQDEAGLKKISAGIASYQALLSSWNDGIGHRASEKLKAIVDHLGHSRDDIAAALRGELPGQVDEGDEWKHSQN